MQEKKMVDRVCALEVLHAAVFVRGALYISRFPCCYRLGLQSLAEGAVSLLAVFYSDLQAPQKIYLFNLIY